MHKRSTSRNIGVQKRANTRRTKDFFCCPPSSFSSTCTNIIPGSVLLEILYLDTINGVHSTYIVQDYITQKQKQSCQMVDMCIYLFQLLLGSMVWISLPRYVQQPWTKESVKDCLPNIQIRSYFIISATDRFGSLDTAMYHNGTISIYL